MDGDDGYDKHSAKKQDKTSKKRKAPAGTAAAASNPRPVTPPYVLPIRSSPLTEFEKALLVLAQGVYGNKWTFIAGEFMPWRAPLDIRAAAKALSPAEASSRNTYLQQGWNLQQLLAHGSSHYQSRWQWFRQKLAAAEAAQPADTPCAAAADNTCGSTQQRQPSQISGPKGFRNSQGSLHRALAAIGAGSSPSPSSCNRYLSPSNAAAMVPAAAATAAAAAGTPGAGATTPLAAVSAAAAAVQQPRSATYMGRGVTAMLAGMHTSKFMAPGMSHEQHSHWATTQAADPAAAAAAALGMYTATTGVATTTAAAAAAAQPPMHSVQSSSSCMSLGSEATLQHCTYPPPPPPQQQQRASSAPPLQHALSDGSSVGGSTAAAAAAAAANFSCARAGSEGTSDGNSGGHAAAGGVTLQGPFTSSSQLLTASVPQQQTCAKGENEGAGDPQLHDFLDQLLNGPSASGLLEELLQQELACFC